MENNSIRTVFTFLDKMLVLTNTVKDLTRIETNENQEIQI